MPNPSLAEHFLKIHPVLLSRLAQGHLQPGPRPPLPKPLVTTALLNSKNTLPDTQRSDSAVLVERGGSAPGWPERRQGVPEPREGLIGSVLHIHGPSSFSGFQNPRPLKRKTKLLIPSLGVAVRTTRSSSRVFGRWPNPGQSKGGGSSRTDAPAPAVCPLPWSARDLCPSPPVSHLPPSEGWASQPLNPVPGKGLHAASSLTRPGAPVPPLRGT